MDIDSSVEGSQEESMQLGAAHRSICNTAEMDPKVPRIFGHVRLVPKKHEERFGFKIRKLKIIWYELETHFSFKEPGLSFDKFTYH
ncbi:unnamed protein product [Bubo scandiacus]